ncbi:MAG: acylneuraminate cytidylyltransferase family protein [Phycisphaerae bacterium]|nr:acylneuraminate cytidylyltransferase family protein [Phycisphaerae bacterium]
MLNVLAIIPARGGSKGLPRKNVLPLAGRPLIAHTIGHALTSRRVTRTVVSTDDAEIELVSRAAGAEVVHRPPALATDASPSEGAVSHVLDALCESEGYLPDLVVFLQATSPLREAGDIDGAIHLLLREEADSVLSVCASHDFLWTNDGRGARPLNYDPARRPRRQEMQPQFRENGSIYVFRTVGYLKHRCRLFGKVGLFVQTARHGMQVDTETDFAFIESFAHVPLLAA